MSTSTGPYRPEVPSNSLLDHTLRTAPLKVVYSTITFSTPFLSLQCARNNVDTCSSVAGLGGIVGAATGVARGIEAIPASFKTSLNTGIFSFTFFSKSSFLSSRKTH
jgi:hypothetical protein